MLSKVNRLKKKKDFENIAKKGRVVNAGFLVLKFVNNNIDKTRVGFVISKKVLNRAVDRNKIKRRLRQAVRSVLLDIKAGYDIAFFARHGIEKQEKERLEGNVKGLLTRAGLFK